MLAYYLLAVLLVLASLYVNYLLTAAAVKRGNALVVKELQEANRLMLVKLANDKAFGELDGRCI